MNRLSFLCLATLLILGENAFLGEAAPPTKWNCDEKDEKSIDQLVGRIMTIGRADSKFPEDTQKLKPFCDKENGMIVKLEDYKDTCLKEQPKQVVSIIIYSIKGLLNLYCKNPNAKRTKELIASAKCANDATNDYYKCNGEYIDLLLAVWDSKDSRQNLGQMCCGYVDVFRCAREKAAPHKSCTEKHVESNINFIKGIFDNAVNVICGDYNENSDKCDKFKLARKPKNVKSKYESFFNPLVHTLSNL